MERVKERARRRGFRFGTWVWQTMNVSLKRN